MFKNHPKALYVLFFSNMGERFGYYTMMAIFTLFMQAKYGFGASETTQIFGIFMACVYFAPLIGGIIADKVFGYGKTISIGLIVMFVGYLLLAIPSTMNTGLPLVITALAVISLGTGFFKGNLQALVGSLYDDPKYSKNRDIAFNIFYMGINIGAMFAPTAAETISNWILGKANFFYNAEIPALAHKFLNGDLSVHDKLLSLAAAQHANVTDLTQFCTSYLNVLSESYHYAFGIACISLIGSMLVFWGFRKLYKHVDLTEKQKKADKNYVGTVVELTPEQTRQRLMALGLVFFVVIFFWMAFQQNGATMTIFARDYVQGSVGHFTNLWFDLFGLLPIFLAVACLYMIFRKESTSKVKILSAIGLVVFAVLAIWRFEGYADLNPFTPSKFQHFNPFFIVALTPLIVGIFGYYARKGKDPSAPRKIAFGMLITAVAFSLLVVGSVSLIGYSPKDINEVRAPADMLVSPYWLISTYFMLTVAELFLSPMGISFVSKVAPPKYKGLMQGGWFAATAIGNYAVGVTGMFWNKLPLWSFWLVLVICCLLSAAFIFSVLKRLEAATK